MSLSVKAAKISENCTYLKSVRPMETDEKVVVNFHSIENARLSSESRSIQSTTNQDQDVTLKANMIDHLAYENKAFFRSQQINDPDITENERKAIAEDILQQSHKKFLFRFGSHIKAEHLSYFENQSYSADDEYEVQYLLRDIRAKIKNRARDVRNRRYAALQKMLDSTSYFSEKEMMAREPLLYEQLIGRYMTDGEKRLRDGVDSDIEFSGILLERISNDHVTELKQKQEVEEQNLIEYDDTSDDSSSRDEDGPSHKNGIINEKLFPQTPTSFRQHWGEFDTKDCEAKQSDISVKRVNAKQNYITAEEKELLKDEFIGIMHTKFLSGEDSEFNYSEVDDNLDYDNIEIESQDQEDKYFEDDEDDDFNDSISHRTNGGSEASTEDELDDYMKQVCNSDSLK